MMLPSGSLAGLDEQSVLEGNDQKQDYAFKPRAYQLEMLAESLRRNIIVAMDTGSGKTLTAVMRVQAELERCPSEKIVFFCVPNVALAYQQYHVFSTQLPTFQARVLSGADNCEFWSEQWIWDKMLSGVRIVISTYEILRSALTHDFIRMTQIALLVFDEAHHATKNHPASLIMRNFYHRASEADRPFILGLTASPLANAKIENLGTLESNLNAISRTPKLHRDELLLHVHQPELIELLYPRLRLTFAPSKGLRSLALMYERLDVEQDPWVRKLRSDPDSDSRALKKVLMSHKTYCHNEIKGLHDTALNLALELGTWATDYYIGQCIHNFRSGSSGASYMIESLEDAERAYLKMKFGEVETPPLDQEFLLTDRDISPKVRTLIDFLAGEESRGFSGLVFVRTRVEVAVLCELLSIHPRTRSFSVSTFVGASGFSGRKNTIGELADIKTQRSTLDDFRMGRRNLIITTNALEEGIDVSACNVVICFELPKNLKSFVQRRGRARNSTSKYVLMFDDAADPEAMSKWQLLEEEMRRMYEDDRRQIEAIRQSESEEEDDNREFVVKGEDGRIGAKINLGDALSHLYHFCATLTTDPFVDPLPIFFIEKHSSDLDTKEFSAKVLLPNSVDASVREAHSKSRWGKQKSAKKDAAFEAYVALYHAGLVNDNLLPVGHVDPEVDEAYLSVEKRPNLVEVSEQVNIWPSIAEEWAQEGVICQSSRVTIRHNGESVVDMMMILPIPIPKIASFELFWDADTTFDVEVDPDYTTYPNESVNSAASVTSLLLHSVLGRKMTDGMKDFTVLFVPADAGEPQAWLDNHSGTIQAVGLTQKVNGPDIGIVRDRSQHSKPHIFLNVGYAELKGPLEGSAAYVTRCTDLEKLRFSTDDFGLKTGGRETCHDSVETDDHSNQQSVLLEVRRFPKRTDFLHPVPGLNTKCARGSGIALLSANNCEIDKLPLRYSCFASLIPSILHVVHKTMIVDSLCNTLLFPLHFGDRTLVSTAICASSAREPSDYQRLEFLGDSILKLSTSLVLMAENLKYHEGILSHKKDHIVSNGPLARAAMETGLDRYILRKAFTGRKWRPLYNSCLRTAEPSKCREMSTKVLADVVEALVGAAYLDGGFEKALACLAIFLPKVSWSIALKAGPILLNVYGFHDQPAAYLEKIERCIQYKFNVKSLLLEAITHASYRGSNTSASYQRLEFIGDSILDHIVTTTLYADQPPIPTHLLHLIRTALVNANFLGYLCIRLSTLIPHFDIEASDTTNIFSIENPKTFSLWQSMRFVSPNVSAAQQACRDCYVSIEATISNTLACGNHYPWTTLARLEPPKFMSDIVESIIGAIYIDSHGSMSTCSTFLEHLGLMPYLRRLMKERTVALLHPKEELGQLADQEKVRYVLGTEGEDGETRLACTIMVGEREVAQVGDGLSKMEVQTRAADVACEILRQESRGPGKSRQSGAKETSTQADNIDGNETDEDGGRTEDGEVASISLEDEDVDDDVYMTADE